MCCVLFLVCFYICVCESLLLNNITGVPSSRVTSRFPQYCASTCARFGCTRHARCVDSNPKSNIHIIPWSIAGVPSSQALPGFHIAAPPFVLVHALLGALAVWIEKKKITLHGDLFYPLDRRSAWVFHTLGNAPVPGS